MLIDRHHDRLGSRPSFLAVASMMRLFAWWGTTQSTSADRVRRPPGFGEHRGEVHDRVAEHLLALHPELAHRARGGNAAVDEQQIVVPSRRRGAWCEDAAILASSAFRRSAPAPSPKRTQVVRSSQSSRRLNVSDPITRA
jgi:hypothetical protein